MIACSADCIEWIKIGISALTPVSIFLAFLAYRANLKKIRDDKTRERDREYVTQFQKSLEWSFNSLTDDGRSMPPMADRLNWLTAARHILRAKKIASQIAHPTYKTIADEFEEYWRHKFYMALADPALRDWHYFIDKEAPAWPENIEIRSALVIMDFSNWKDGTPDPTDAVDRENFIKHVSGIKGSIAGRSLETYINHLEKLKAPRRGDSRSTINNTLLVD